MPTQADMVGFFKTTELFFMCYLAVIAFCLVNPRRTFEKKIDFFNKMLKLHHLEGRVAITEKAVQNFRRDKWILFFLILIIIFLIQTL